MKPSNLLVHEMIGRKVCVVRSTDPGIQGLEGRILDETMNTLVISNSNGARVQVQKAKNSFQFDVDGQKVTLEGDNFMFRPQDRIKKLYHKKDKLIRK